MFAFVPPEWLCLRSLVVGQRRGGKHICSQWRSSQDSCRGLERKMGRKWMLTEEAAVKCLTRWRCGHQRATRMRNHQTSPCCRAALPIPSVLLRHPALPMKTFAIHLGFPYRSPLKAQCAVQLKGKRLHSTHCSSETAHTPCQVKMQNTRVTSGSRSYTWQQKVSPFHCKISFPVPSLTDAMSNLWILL